MREPPLSHISCSMPLGDRAKLELIRHSYGWDGFTDLRRALDFTLKRLGLEDKLLVRAIIYRMNPPEENEYRVFLAASRPEGVAVFEESWDEFPSEELETKLLLLGG